MIALFGTATSAQSSSNQTPAIAPGFATGYYHLIYQAVKNNADSVAPTPSGYDDIVTRAGSGGGQVIRVSLKQLTLGDTAPTLVQGGIAVQYISMTLSGLLLDTVANVIAATTPATSSASSSTAIAYASSGLPTEDNCAIFVMGAYNSVDSATLGTPSTMVAAQTLLDASGTNMHAGAYMDVQTTAAPVSLGSIPVTGGSTQTCRSVTFSLRAAATVITGAGGLMMMGVG